MISERIRYFDIAKGILIILLVFAHFRSAVIRLPFESPYFEYVYGWNSIFTCFYMPAFFLISGYCSNFNKPVKTFLTAQLKTLLLPIITLSFLTVVATSAIYHENVLERITASALRGGELWFLWALFWGKIIVYLVEIIRPSGGGYKVIVTLFLLVLGVALNQYKIGENILYYQHGLIASLWIHVGYCLRLYPTIYEKSLKWSLVVYPLVAVASFFKDASIVAGIYISILTIPLHLVYAYTGTMFLLAICKNIRTCRWLELWGRNSLVVYALHFVPLLFFANSLWTVFEPQTVILFMLYFVTLYAVEYGICWLLIWLFQYRPFSWLIGKF